MSVVLTVLTAVTGRWEAPLVQALEADRTLRVVRRCADLGELLAAAAAGRGRAVVLSADLRRLDREALDRLAHAGTAVVGLVEPGDEQATRRLRQLGVARVLPADAPAAQVAAAVTAAVAGMVGPRPSSDRADPADALNAGATTPDRTTSDPGGPDPGGPDPGGPDPGGPDPGGPDPGGPDPSGPDTSSADPVGSQVRAAGSPAEVVPADAPTAAQTARDQDPAVAGTGTGTGTDGRTHRPDQVGTGTPQGAITTEVARHSGIETGDGAIEPVPGGVVAVWGPTGAPGRTTVAVILAWELAVGATGPAGADLERVVLADADTWGGSIAQVLGLLDEAPGLAAAARAAGQGTLDLERLGRLAPRVAPVVRVLTGLSGPGRWPELRPSGLEAVWRRCRELAPWTVVDCGFSLEQDEELSYDTAAPRRNGATLATLAAADRIVAVGSADPVGLQRLVRGLQDLRETVPGASVQVVVNRVRASAVGADPDRRVRQALSRYAGVEDPVLVPDDRSGCDAALLAGRALPEVAPRSPARAPLAAVAARWDGRDRGTAVGRRSAALRRRAAMGA